MTYVEGGVEGSGGEWWRRKWREVEVEGEGSGRGRGVAVLSGVPWKMKDGLLNFFYEVCGGWRRRVEGGRRKWRRWREVEGGREAEGGEEGGGGEGRR
jgi:hypothetical protein